MATAEGRQWWDPERIFSEHPGLIFQEMLKITMHPAPINLLWKPTPPAGMRSSMHPLSLPARATVCLTQAQGWQKSRVSWWDHRSCEQTERSSHHTPLSWLSCSRKVLQAQDICKACCQLLVKALSFPDVSYCFLLEIIDNALGWITDILKLIRLYVCVCLSHPLSASPPQDLWLWNVDTYSLQLLRLERHS